MTVVSTAAPLLIGLYSSTQRQGKSTVANLIKARIGRTTIMSFANPVKLATASFLEALGLSDVEATEAVFDHKDTTIPGLGITGRDALVLIGTKAGREGVSQDCWVNALFRRADAFRSKAELNVVIDDVRMPNEADAIIERGGFLVRVSRQVKLDKVDPTTEGRLDGFRFDAVIQNNGSLTDLNEAVRAALRHLRSLA